jgi:hypothetical protein
MSMVAIKGAWGVVATHRDGRVDRIVVQGDSVQRGGRCSAMSRCYVVVDIRSALQAPVASPQQLVALVVAFPPFLSPSSLLYSFSWSWREVVATRVVAERMEGLGLQHLAL